MFWQIVGAVVTAHIIIYVLTLAGAFISAVLRIALKNGL